MVATEAVEMALEAIRTGREVPEDGKTPPTEVEVLVGMTLEDIRTFQEVVEVVATPSIGVDLPVDLVLERI